jgi:hypothetical protein
MACHTMNMPYMALSLGAPTAVTADVAADGRANMSETAPMGCTVTYEFPARGNMPACRLYWYERRTPPRALFLDGLQPGQNPSASGMLLVGSRGTLYSNSDYGGSRQLLPTRDFANYEPPEPTLPRSPGHHAEWLRACKGGPPAMSNFVDYAGPLSEMVLLGNVAMRVGQRLEWDSTNLRVTNVSTAAQYIHREYRRGWELTAEREPQVTQAGLTTPAPNGVNQPQPRFPRLRRLLGRR